MNCGHPVVTKTKPGPNPGLEDKHDDWTCVKCGLAGLARIREDRLRSDDK